MNFSCDFSSPHTPKQYKQPHSKQAGKQWGLCVFPHLHMVPQLSHWELTTNSGPKEGAEIFTALNSAIAAMKVASLRDCVRGSIYSHCIDEIGGAYVTC